MLIVHRIRAQCGISLPVANKSAERFRSHGRSRAANVPDGLSQVPYEARERIPPGSTRPLLGQESPLEHPRSGDATFDVGVVEDAECAGVALSRVQACALQPDLTAESCYDKE